MDNIYGYIPSINEWEKAGGRIDKAKVISLTEFKPLYENNGIQLVDLRGVAEYNSGHIKGAENVFVGSLLNNLDKISKDKKVVIHCQGGDRSSIAYSLLAKNGYTNILNYSAGMNEWINEGNPVIS